MFARALLVSLLVLNAGVATWWATRPLPPAASAVASPPDMTRLQLLEEVPRATVGGTLPATDMVDPAPRTSPAPIATTAGANRQCFSLGPFSSDGAAMAAQARLQQLARRIVVREQRRGAARGWRVLLPALPDADTTEATAQRIAAAGFGDYFVVREGSEANSIALGRYGNEPAARRRAAALVAAGFAARAEALGVYTLWLDISAAGEMDAVAAQQRAAARERRLLDCAAFDRPAAPAR